MTLTQASPLHVTNIEQKIPLLVPRGIDGRLIEQIQEFAEHLERNVNSLSF